MEPYARKYPLFALCGLNCGLCPRFHTDGTSRCPGCGGEDFHLKHPACHVITCNRKHDSVEFCFQCGEYPCKRYSSPSPVDSFITYTNVLADFEKARRNMGTYRKELDTKVTILRELLDNYNDGRRKSFYCLAVNLLPLPQLKEIMKSIDKEIKPLQADLKEKAKLTVEKIEAAAAKLGIEFKLRAKQ